MSSTNRLSRKYIMHPAHDTIGVSAPPQWDKDPLRPLRPSRSPQQPPQILLVTDPCDYEAHQSLNELEEFLARGRQADCHRTFRRPADNLPAWEDLQNADCVVLFAQQVITGDEPLWRLRRFCDMGGSIIGVGAVDDDSPTWSALDHEVFGTVCLGQCSDRPTRVKRVEAATDHPVLAGVEPFVSSSVLRRNFLLADHATGLLLGESAENRHLVAWTRPYRQGRVFYTSLGHREDFQHRSFLQLLANAVEWTCEV